MKIHFLLALVLAALLTVPAFCQAEKPLVFGSTGNIEPFAFKENGHIKGFYKDIFDDVAKRAGFQVEYELYPFKRLNDSLQKGKIDGTVSIFYKKERESYLVYSSKPIITSRTRVFVKKGKEFPLHTIKDLYGKKIGIIAGWILHHPEYNRAKDEGKFVLQQVTNYEQNLKKLMADRFDCFIMTEQMTWYQANKMGIGDKIAALDMIFSEVRGYIAISKKSPNITKPKIFMENLDAAFDEILQDGTYENLQRKYGIKTLKDVGS